MEILQWLYNNAEAVLQNVGIIGGLLFTGVSLRSEVRARRVGNLIAITDQHRNIWTLLYQRPELTRVLEANADLAAKPPTIEERLFVRSLILYLGAVYKAIEFDEMLRPDGLAKDVREFFALPVPSAIWEALKEFQDEDFVEFVDGLLSQ